MINIKYEVNELKKSGEIKNSQTFETKKQAIKFYNTLTCDKELLQKIEDLQYFEELYSFYNIDNSGTKTITQKDIFYTLESENNVRENLYLEQGFDDFWKEQKESILHTLGKYEDYLQQNNFSYCFESDWQEEKNYMQECNIKIKKIFNDNGIIIYKKFEKGE